MELDYKSVSLEIKREPDADGRFEGYASVFGVLDKGMDIVERGAFAKSIQKFKPKMLWQHDTRQVIGVWEDVKEDERGLYVKGRLLDAVEKGREALALMKEGAIDSMSIGFKTLEASDEGRVRHLKEVELWEISVVTFPMLPDAKITAVKSIKTEREFECVMRDAGFTRREATAIALYGFKGLADQRDAVEVEADSEGLKALHDQIRQLQEKLHV